MNSPDGDTPIHDQVATENPNGTTTEALPWPNQEPVVDGIDPISQDPMFVADVVSEDEVAG